jgi:hypothetical protein
MQNLFLVPTEKPSRLTKINDELFFGKNEREMLSEPSLNIVAQHIYITSDEQPKHNDYYTTDGKEIYYCNTLNPTRNNHYKKIILTTDQDLIADGVQSIDDEFLEWFVKNPSCEFVEVKKGFEDGTAWGYNFLDYKIIIPQAEPKQETLTYTEASKKEERIFNSTMMSKQETLEEAAANLADPNLCKTDNWIAGANYQAERMYSEEEVYSLLEQSMKDCYLWELEGHYSGDYKNLKKWFEQFKNK